jgi:hypothetical protein
MSVGCKFGRLRSLGALKLSGALRTNVLGTFEVSLEKSNGFVHYFWMLARMLLEPGG